MHENRASCYKLASFAGVAQLVEQPTCNRQVAGSSPAASKSLGGVAEWPNATDCKSVDVSLRWFESNRPQTSLLPSNSMTKKWKKSSAELVECFYEALKNHPDAELRKMFGYPCAFLGGHMFAGLHEENFAIRLNSERREELLTSGEGAIFAPMKGRVMREYVALDPAIVANKEKLKEFLLDSFNYVSLLPPKK